MDEYEEIEGFIREPRFDYNHDYGHGSPVIYLTVDTDLGSADQAIGWNDGGLSALAFLRRQKCKDLKELENTRIKLMSNHFDCYIHPDEFNWGNDSLRWMMQKALIRNAD